MKTLNKILETVLGLLVAVMVLGCIWPVSYTHLRAHET